MYIINKRSIRVRRKGRESSFGKINGFGRGKKVK